jgi:hypothetical protein
MAGTDLSGKGPNFPITALDDGALFEWMWWRWKWVEDTTTPAPHKGDWIVDTILDSPSEDTPGLVYYTPTTEEPVPHSSMALNEWWWIPHVTSSETGEITTHGKLYVRDRSNLDGLERSSLTGEITGTNAQVTGYGTQNNVQWTQVQTNKNSDPSLRGLRGKTIWADYGPPEQDLLIDGNRPNVPPADVGPLGAGDVGHGWPYEGDVDDLLGDMYLDLAGLKIYGPKQINPSNQLPYWGNGISLLGDIWATWRGEWSCQYEHDYQQAPHDVVSHQQYNKNIIETWICKETHTPSCDAAIIAQTILTTTATEAGDIGHPPAVQNGNYLYFRHDHSPTSSNHYYLQLVPHKWMGDGGAIGTYDTVSPPTTSETIDESVTYDETDSSHTLVQIKVGGEEHSMFRFRTPGTTTWIYETGTSWFSTEYVGGGQDNGNSDLNAAYTYAASMPNCWVANSGSAGFVGNWSDGSTVNQIMSFTVSNALYHASKKLNTNYTEGANTWGLNFWFNPSIGLNVNGQLTLINEGISDGTVGYPQFYMSVADFRYHRGDCSGDNESLPDDCDPAAPQSNIWSVQRDFMCLGSGSLYVYDLTKTLGTDSLVDTSPFDGSQYWDRMLGALNHGDISVVGGLQYFTAKQSGVEFRFGGFHPQDWQPRGQITFSEVYWRDYKTFDQIPMDQKRFDYGSYLSMGETTTADIDSGEDIAVNYPSMNVLDDNYSRYYREWGFTGASDNARWIRTVGRNYNKSAKATGTVNDWTDHGDTYEVNDGSGSTVQHPLPNHWLCLKPGNTYKITIGAWVKPQYFPVISKEASSNIAPVTWRMPTSGGTSISPLADFQNGWYELMLYTFPSAFPNDASSNPVTQAAYGADQPHLVEEAFRNTPLQNPVAGGIANAGWWVPFNTHIHGIGSPKDIQMIDGDLVSSLIDPKFCLSYMHCTFDASDFVEHDAQIPITSLTIADNEDALNRYRGSEKPTWDTTLQDWAVGTDWKTYNIRNNSKFIQDSFLYTPTEEWLSEGSIPGSSWIALYYDASWWGNGVYSATEIFNQAYQGEHTEDIGRGTMAFYPDEADGWYESNPDKDEAFYGDSPPVSSLHRKGGFLRIELVNDVN